jgi:hypothetical protein
VTQRHCRICNGWHELGDPWPDACLGHFGSQYAKTSDGVQIIKDIEPYQAMGSDVAAGGNAPQIGGRRQHREYLKRNGYHEVGTEPVRQKQVDYQDVSPREIRRAYEELRDGRSRR